MPQSGKKDWGKQVAVVEGEARKKGWKGGRRKAERERGVQMVCRVGLPPSLSS